MAKNTYFLFVGSSSGRCIFIRLTPFSVYQDDDYYCQQQRANEGMEQNEKRKKE